METIEVEFPHYYRYDISEDYHCMVVGKIEENLNTSIQESFSEDSKEYLIRKEEYSSIMSSGLSSCFEDRHKSTQQEFEEMKQRAADFLNRC